MRRTPRARRSEVRVEKGLTLVIFDGVCGLCNRTVAWIIARDHHRRFRFAPLQSDAARAILAARGILEFPESVIVVQDDVVRTHSDAALAIARTLGMPWSLACVFRVVPRCVRDWMYRVLAANRYRWFGRREECMVPSADVRERFLGGDAGPVGSGGGGE